MSDKIAKKLMTDTDKFRAILRAERHSSSDLGKYLTAVIISLMIGVGGLSLIVFIRPEYDPILVAGIIFAFLTPTTTSILGLMKAAEAKEQAIETHLSVNSRLDKFIEQAAVAARAEGMDAGRKAANERTDELEKAKKFAI